ncbi:bifunctional 4-hydroxy-2-oxoglutarate aldolase/2-dehydro-3-deoxy-phosphogluconate aldolase [Feifania hominis]|uniref:Bifunctional 4-hydroxy-2-oxoglutarate aldolase/2-dehydro-3-deoxy-phosphogluconate aldolase n=1 Tax=Feifania hominis TaxID=2763660 RepID=A0A926DBN4_9FIRM|nr:bifunctional 4-hydroxy-2-oxoglutarate aldolase/2-dehydro-3-deoxy-phosphogluconate aldolase [Feifania hominis]MBC8536005.1 bifunctional 4-hydroxy-2-oxoglutarate aldolase/2-dehydro-3-deoxy-phosphogluconate aldolase [Feifania hominis]
MKRKIELLKTCRVIGVIDAADEQQALRLAQLYESGGVMALLVRLSKHAPVSLLSALGERYSSSMVIGAGNVTDADTAFEAVEAGARFIETPSFDTAIFKTCGNLSVPAIPEAFSPGEVRRALALGAEIVELYPAVSLGADYFELMKNDHPAAAFMAAGGVTEENAARFAGAGADLIRADFSRWAADEALFVRKVKAILSAAQSV